MLRQCRNLRSLTGYYIKLLQKYIISADFCFLFLSYAEIDAILQELL